MLCKPGAEVRFVFEHDSAPEMLEAAYREVGLALTGRPLSIEEARVLPTTWAKKLGYSGRSRRFWEFQGQVTITGTASRS